MSGLLNTLASVEILTGTGWDLRSFLKNSTDTIGDWISLAVTLLGIIAVGWSIWIIVSGLMSQGRKQTNWAIAIILLLVGGALSVAGGFEFVKGIAAGGKRTIEDLGNGGMIMLYQIKSFLP